jgi:hypothetical protein
LTRLVFLFFLFYVLFTFYFGIFINFFMLVGDMLCWLMKRMSGSPLE